MICLINYSISPYHYIRFTKLQEKFQNNIIFVELASIDKSYQWKSHADQLNALTLFPGVEFSTVNSKEMVRSLIQLLNRIKPDVVVAVSYDSAAIRAATIWARKNKAISVCINDSWKGDKQRLFFWEMIKGLWCRFAYDGMFLSGSLSKSYYQGIGYPGSKIWLGQNCVNNDLFSANRSLIRLKKDEYFAKYKLPSNYFLCVARLSPEKNLERLLRSYCVYRAKGGNWNLVILGSGPLDQTLKNLAKKLNIDENVFFMGWKQIDELPIFYSLASCLILPSISEPWGNAVNEAMASGLPILVSNKCGCMPELCFRGVNGFDFNPYNEKEITNVMLKISSDDCDKLSMSKASLAIIQKYSPENYMASFSDCIETLQKN